MILVYSLGPACSVDRPGAGSLSVAEKARVAPSISEREENGSAGSLEAPEDAGGDGKSAGILAGRGTGVGEVCSFAVENPLGFASSLSPDGTGDSGALEVFFGTSVLSNKLVNEPDPDAAEGLRSVLGDDVTWTADSRLGG